MVLASCGPSLFLPRGKSPALTVGRANHRQEQTYSTLRCCLLSILLDPKRLFSLTLITWCYATSEDSTFSHSGSFVYGYFIGLYPLTFW